MKKGNDVIEEAKESLNELVAVLGTSFGPVGACKMIRDSGGRTLITKHGGTIVRNFGTSRTEEHPVAGFVRSIATKGLEERFGDGTTTFLIALEAAVTRILEKAPSVTDPAHRRKWLTQLALDFSKISHPGGVLERAVDEVDRELAIECEGAEMKRRICDTSLSGQFSPTVCDVVAGLACGCSREFGLLTVPGMSIRESRNVVGIAIERELKVPSSETRTALEKGAAVVLITCDFTGFPESTTPSTVGEFQRSFFQDFRLSEKKARKHSSEIGPGNRFQTSLEVTEFIGDLDRNAAATLCEISGAMAVVCAGVISPDARQEFATRKVATIEHVPGEDIERLARGIGVTPLVETTPGAIRDQLGGTNRISFMARVGTLWTSPTEVIFIEPVEKCDVSTIIICGPSEGLVTEFERAFRRTMKLIRSWRESPQPTKVVPGGGSWESKVVSALTGGGIISPSTVNPAVDVISRAMISIPRRLLQNESRSNSPPLPIIMSLDRIIRSRESEIGVVIIPGIEQSDGLVGNPLLNGIVEPLFLK